jgi:hypothetical protein
MPAALSASDLRPVGPTALKEDVDTVRKSIEQIAPN